MSVEIYDYSIKVKEALDEAVNQWLEEASSELEAQTKRRTRVGAFEGYNVKDSWDHLVDESKSEAKIGSPMEAAFWEEFGTGEHALNKDGRKGWWVYIEGQESGKGGKSYPTREEAEESAKFLRKVKKLNAYATNGIDPNRPLHRAFDSGKNAVQAIFAEKLKGLG